MSPRRIPAASAGQQPRVTQGAFAGPGAARKELIKHPPTCQRIRGGGMATPCLKKKIAPCEHASAIFKGRRQELGSNLAEGHGDHVQVQPRGEFGKGYPHLGERLRRGGGRDEGSGASGTGGTWRSRRRRKFARRRGFCSSICFARRRGGGLGLCHGSRWRWAFGWRGTRCTGGAAGEPRRSLFRRGGEGRAVHRDESLGLVILQVGAGTSQQQEFFHCFSSLVELVPEVEMSDM